MATFDLLMIPGDGIGPEVMAEVAKVVTWLNKRNVATFNVEHELAGGAAIDTHGVNITDAAVAKAQKADAMMFGCGRRAEVGHSSRSRTAPRAASCGSGRISISSPTSGPRCAIAALADASSLKRELVEGLDIMILRELTGGTYFGEPKEIVTLENGQQRAVDTTVYTTREIERIVRVGFEMAKKRKGILHSAEKRNVMKTGVLWNQVATRVHREEFPTLKLEHILADACAMALVRNPKQFDVIVCDNLFGDMLSDEAAMLAGSLGMLPSASLGARDKSRQGEGAVRADPRLGARYRRQGHRQSDRHHRLVRHGAALLLRHARGRRHHRQGDLGDARRWRAHRRHRGQGPARDRHQGDGRCHHQADGADRGVGGVAPRGAARGGRQNEQRAASRCQLAGKPDSDITEQPS